MFEQNKWFRIYESIVQKAKKRGLNRKIVTFPTEIHHIIPKSAGGGEDKNNLVLLSLKEHFVCHHLLTKCLTGIHLHKAKHAYAQMVHCGKFSPTARQYEQARLFYAESGRSKGWREKISRANKGKKRTSEQIETMRKRLTGRKLSEKHKYNIKIALQQRGMSTQCRKARLQTLVKQFQIIYPNGTIVNGINLKQYCVDNDINYRTASNNSKTNKPVSRGPLKGYNFKRIK